MLITISFLSFLTVFCFVIGLYLIITAKKREISFRLNKFTRTPGQVIIDEQISNKEKFTPKNILVILGKVFETRSYTKKIENELLKADIPMRGSEFIVISIFLIFGSGILGFILGGLGSLIVFVVLGLICPNLFIKKKKKARFERINQEIGECLTVLSNSLRAGYSFQQSIELVSKEMNGPLAMEFGKTLREINLGTPTEQALSNMAHRVESDDLDLMITAVLIQRQIGGNLAEILDNISNTLRERIRIKGEIKTLTAQGRISGLVIALMPPILFAILLVIDPGYISVLLHKQIGIYMLLTGVCSQIIGFIFIRKIVNIEF